MSDVTELDDLPEALRRRIQSRRRESTVQVKTGDASEDGDFVRLREVREIKKDALEEENRLAAISETNDDELAVVVPSVKDANFSLGKSPSKTDGSRPLSPGQRNIRLDKAREEMVAVIRDGSVSAVEEKLVQIRELCTEYDENMLDPENNRNFLHIALDMKKTDIAAYLIQRCDKMLLIQEFLLSGKAKKTALHQITELKDVTLAEKALSKIGDQINRQAAIKMETMVDIVGQRPRTFTCFHLAAFLGCTELVKLYLEQGISVNLPNAKNDTALLWAARWGHDRTVKYLLDKNADPSLENDKKSTALYWAVRYEHASTVMILLSQGKANPNQERLLGLVKPIVLASALGNAEIVETLIHYGADINTKIPGGATPLHHAAKEGHVKVIKLLLKHGAEINQQDDKGDTPLTLATYSGHCAAVKVLVYKGGKISHKNHAGHDAWYYAINNEKDDILEILVQSWTEVSLNNNADDTENISPLFVAASLGKCDKIKKLLKMNVDPTIKDKDGNTFMHYAATHDRHNVIEMFQSKMSIDVQNNSGSTPLHIACANGYENTVQTLIKNKAKTNIQNTKGESALHVAAYSRSTTPEIAKSLIEHTIKTHAWQCVNAFDNEGNNALHLAAKFAKPSVLWEFRFVRFKDADVDGNYPLHESVRPGDPEALDTMLDIYECMERDADINAVNYKKQESVLHLAASEGFHHCVARLIFYGADLTIGDCDGNTVLHRLVKESVRDESLIKQQLAVLDTIIKESVRWWCQRRTLTYPSRDKDLFQRYQREAMLYLMNEVGNAEKLSVITYATKLGAYQVLSRLLMLEGVTMFKMPDLTLFDVTHITPKTNEEASSKALFVQQKIAPRDLSFSSIEHLLTLRDGARASQVLDIPPLRHLERMYTRICAWFYAFIMVLHLAYMAVFTYLGVELSVKMRETNGTVSHSEPQLIVAYVIVPIEPLLWILYVLRVYCCTNVNKGSETKKSAGRRFLLAFLNLSPTLTFCCLTIVWIILISIRHTYHDYILATSLCVGWLLSISLTRGFKGVHYFWRMLQNMILRDIFRFLIVYLFVLLAFSFALHVLFQISESIVETYSSPGDTLFLTFNLMIGMAELFDDNFEQGMEAVDRTTVFAKVFYIFYILLSTVVLLNLLIAMMNDSYSDILNNQAVSWRIDSVDIGIDVEKFFSWAPRIFGRLKLEKRVIDKASVGERWFLVLDPDYKTTSLMLGRERGDPIAKQLTQIFEKKFDDLERRVANTEKHVSETNDKLSDIMRMLSDLKDKKQVENK